MKAIDLRAGDVISVPNGRGVIHRISLKRTSAFVAHWYRTGNSSAESFGEVTFDSTEEVEVHRRFEA